MSIQGRNAFDNAARAQEISPSKVRWQGDLEVTGTITATGGESGAVNLPNDTYLTAENAAASGTLNLLKADASDDTILNTPTGKFGGLAINGTSILKWVAGIFEPVVDGAIALGTSALGFGTLFHSLGKTTQLKAGVNAKAGTFTANGTTPVSVATTSFVAGSAVIISLKTVGGTVGPIPHLATATAGTGFTVVGTAADTSVYNWAIIDQA